MDLQDSPELSLLSFPDIRQFESTAPRTITVDLGEPLQIPCPAHGASYGAVYTWSGGENIKFPRNDRRAISATGELFIMFVTEDDIKLTEQLKGISCTMTGANTIFKSGPLTLKKRAGNNLLHCVLYCLTVGHFRPQRRCCFRSAPKNHNLLLSLIFFSMWREFVSYSQPIRVVMLNSEHVQS